MGDEMVRNQLDSTSEMIKASRNAVENSRMILDESWSSNVDTESEFPHAGFSIENHQAIKE